MNKANLYRVKAIFIAILSEVPIFLECKQNIVLFLLNSKQRRRYEQTVRNLSR